MLITLKKHLSFNWINSYWRKTISVNKPWSHQGTSSIDPFNCLIKTFYTSKMVVEPLYICLNKNIYVTDIVSIHYVNVIGRRYTTKTKFFFFLHMYHFLLKDITKVKFQPPNIPPSYNQFKLIYVIHLTILIPTDIFNYRFHLKSQH